MGEDFDHAKEFRDLDFAALKKTSSQLLTLTAPEMTVLIGGLRALGAASTVSTWQSSSRAARSDRLRPRRSLWRASVRYASSVRY